MSVVGLLVLIAAIGLIAYGLTTFIEMPAPFKKFIIGVAALIVLLIVLKAFFPEVLGVQVPRL